MRNLWKRGIDFLPQAAAALVLLAAFVVFPVYGVCNAAPRTHDIRSYGVDFIQADDSNSSEHDTVVYLKRHETVLPEKGVAIEVTTPAETIRTSNAKYDRSVCSALSNMRLSTQHLDTWAKQHDRSTLKNLCKMSPNQQQKVATIATYIRRVNKTVSPETAWREASALVTYSAKYGIPAELSTGVAKTESTFNPNSQSRAGALGVMQVIWNIHHGMLSARNIATTRNHMFDPERGVEAGVLLLSRYVRAYGSIQNALCRYYGGISSSYVRRISNNMAMLQVR